MDEQLLQRSRYVLHAYFRRVQKSPLALFPIACNQLLSWLRNHPIYSPIIGKLETGNGAIEKTWGDFLKSLSDRNSPAEKAICVDFYDQAIENLCVIKVIADQKNEELHVIKHLVQSVADYLTGEFQKNPEDSVELLKDIALDGLFEYLDLQIDTRNIIYGVLIKFKKSVEWFSRQEVREIADNGTRGKKGERALASELQKYIFNEGVDFIIEPTSASGEVDLVLKTAEGRYILLDAKYISSDSNRSDIIRILSSGFHQVMRYCEDFNETEGFLVVFVNTNVRIRMELHGIDGLSYLKLGNKQIYYLAVNLHDEPSASKSGKATEITIYEDDLKNNMM